MTFKKTSENVVILLWINKRWIYLKNRRFGILGPEDFRSMFILFKEGKY